VRKLEAAPQSAVITDHNVIEATMILRRLQRSAAIAIGTPSVA
jgi:hypothetical protein